MCYTWYRPLNFRTIQLDFGTNSHRDISAPITIAMVLHLIQTYLKITFHCSHKFHFCSWTPYKVLPSLKTSRISNVWNKEIVKESDSLLLHILYLTLLRRRGLLQSGGKRVGNSTSLTACAMCCMYGVWNLQKVVIFLLLGILRAYWNMKAKSLN